MGCCQQYCALLYKNFTLKRRSYVSTLFELCLPAIVFLVLVIVKELIPPRLYDANLHLDQTSTFNQVSRLALLSESVETFDAILGFFPEDKTADFRNYLTNAGFPASRLRIYDDYQQIYDYTQESDYGSGKPFIYGVLEVDDLVGPDYKYTLHFNGTSADINKYQTASNTQLPLYSLLDAEYDPSWFVFDARGFSLYQDILDNFILEKENVFTWPSVDPLIPPNESLNPAYHDEFIFATHQPFPTRDYRVDDFTTIVGQTLGIVLTLIFIWPLTRIISGLVEEKELKLKASMKLMGLKSSALFFAWFTTYFIIFFIITTLLCLCSFWGLYSYSQVPYIFFVYFIFGLTVFAVGYLISAFFDNAKTASTFGSIVFLLTFFASFASSSEGVKTSTKVLVCLIPTACLSQTGSVISTLEGMAIGVNSSTVAELVDNFSVSIGIGMLLFDFFLYIILGLYFNQVISTEFGISKPWYFCCTPRWWCGSPSNRKTSVIGCCLTETKPTVILPPFDPATSNEDFTKIQPASASDVPLVQIRDLRRTFPGTGPAACCRSPAPFVAVKGLSLDMYKDQIYMVLGENGAGKSTTFNMLTGLLAPTSGEALIDGFSINTDIDSIYQRQGVCFQHNVLYPDLTVYEHMRLFSAVKQMTMSKEDTHEHIVELLNQVGLGPTGDNKVNFFASQLSGGQKRKLSVAIALLNNPRVILLDEPSSGMDVSAQRDLWAVLLAIRKDRVVICTTHDMDEAGVLGNRIGIFASGKLMCSGSNLFLKDTYGVGYTLTVNKNTDIDTTADVLSDDLASPPLNNTPQSTIGAVHDDRTDSEKLATPSTKSGKRIHDFIITNYPFAILSNDTSGEISFRLPMSQAGKFPEMLDSLETAKEDLGITTYGLGVTSLTEVFLRVISGQSREELHVDTDSLTPSADSSGAPLDDRKQRLVDDTWGQNESLQLTKWQTFKRHFRALFIKRLNYCRRDRKAAMWQLLYPGIILLGGMAALKFSVKTEFPSLEMSPSIYPDRSQIVFGPTSTTNPFINNIYDAMTEVIENRYHQEVAFAQTTDTSVAGIQQWLLDTYNDRGFNSIRFGAIIIDDASNIPTADPTLPPQLTFSLHFNTTAKDALPVYRNLLSNGLLATKNPNASITTLSQPLPRTPRLLTFINSTLAFIICIAMSFVPASFAAFVVRERQDSVKHLQLVSGVSNVAYWVSTMAWDVVNFTLPFILFCVIIFAFNVEPFMEPTGIPLVIVTLWLFVLASCPFTYALSFMFNSHTSAQNMTLLINFLTSVVLLVLSLMLTIIESTRELNKILRFFYRLLPGYTLGDVFIQMLIRKNIAPNSKTAWDLDVAGWSLIFFVVDFFLYTGLLILLEHWSANNTLEWIKGGCRSISADDDEKFADPEEDEDVKNLRTKIQSGACDDSQVYPIVLKGLRKVYPSRVSKDPFLAVANVFFSVKKGQTFGFLGANGAGKTTVMKMITSDVYPSAGSGDASLGGFSLLHQSERIRHLLGYCPQFDAILPLLTGREHLTLYANIKCVPKDKIHGYVNFMCKKLEIGHLADRPAGTYSGGNKRKLSLGIALIGNPKILLLDEVSAGVAPSSRRAIWSLISSTMQNRAIILVSHSMEEIVALSSHIGIMASGRLRAYGTATHLQQRHGHGLQIEIESQPGRTAETKSWFSNAFSKGFTVVEEHSVTLKFAIPKESYTMPETFRMMENAKTQLDVGIESYTVSETTLDQIFIDFVRQDSLRRQKNDGERS